VDKTFITIEVGQTAVIKATVSPSGSAVSWDSGDNDIVSVNNSVVTGVSIGATAVIVKAGDKEQRCTVIVKKASNVINPEIYLEHAKSHAAKLGLIYDESLTDGSWNPWINLYGSLSEETMKKNIESALQTLIDENRKYYKLYLEKQTENDYRLFVFYG